MSAPIPLLPRPDWIKARAPIGERYERLRDLMRGLDLHTVCEEARCPNIGDCWNRGHRHLHDPGRRVHARLRLLRGQDRAAGAPARSARRPGAWRDAVARMGLRHAVITSVNRDDQRTAGAGCLRGLHPRDPRARPRVRGRGADPRFQGGLGRAGRRDRGPARHPEPQHGDGAAPLPRGAPGRPLQPLAGAAAAGEGRGPPHEERHHGRAWARSGRRSKRRCARSARRAPTSSPSGSTCVRALDHLPLLRYYTPEEFGRMRDFALALGYRHVESGPLVRSSYHAEEQVPGRERRVGAVDAGAGVPLLRHRGRRPSPPRDPRPVPRSLPRPSENRTDPCTRSSGQAHGAQHVRRLDRPRRAGRPRRDGHAGQVEGHEQALRLDPLEGDVGGVRHARAVAVAARAGDGEEARLQPVAQRAQARRLRGQLLARDGGGAAQARRCRGRSRCRRAGCAPGSRRARTGGGGCPRLT